MSKTKDPTGGDLLREWRRGFGTAMQAATALGVDRNWLYQLEKGDGRPSLELALKIQRVAGVPVGAWVADELQAN